MHYISPSVILSLATGEFVPPIHRKNLYSLQYSMLPAQRATIGEIWQQLNEERPPPPNGAVKIPNGNLRTRRPHR